MSKKLTLLLALLASSYLQAQKDSTQVLDEVTVTANKQLQKQSSTGKVITVISKEQLERQPGRTIAQVLNETAGITIAGAFNNAGTNQSVFMRGAASGRTLILLDGIPVNDPSQINNEFDLNLFSINDVERIEVCRGAQSTIYGGDAVAGVINIITIKQDITKPFHVKFTSTAGNLATFKNNIQVYGKKDRLTYTARYASLKTNGFSTAYDSTGTKDFDKDGYTGSSSNAGLQYQVTNQLLVKSFVMYNQYRSSIDAGTFTDDRYYAVNNNMLNTGGGFIFKKSSYSITGNYQFSQTNRAFERDSTDKAVFNYFQRNIYFAKTQFAELFTNIKINNNLSLLQGVEYRYASMNNQFRSVSSFGPYSSGFRDTSVSQTSVYTSLLVDTKTGFATDMGIRYNHHSQYGTNYTVTFNPSYQVNTNTRIFGSVATAFKTPSLFQLYDQFSGRATLAPEKSTTIEAGIAYKTGNFSNRVVLFHRTIRDGIDYDYIRFRYFNFVKQTTVGVEYEAALKLNDHFSLRTNFTFLSITDSTQSRVSFKDTAYTHGLRRPGINMNIVLDYTYNKFSGSVTAKYVSSRFDVGGYKRADILLPEYFLLNGYVGYTLHKYFRIFADVQNITGNQFFDIRGFNSIPFIFNTGFTFNW
ncbi:MAG: TonB-dependent receptor [Chitinophagaceae bacterium]|nr:TonB-dependent receptor [Chitinophagaceae bacterium]